MVTSDEVIANWNGMIDNNFERTIRDTFKLPDSDNTLYGASPSEFTLEEIQEKLNSGIFKYHYNIGHQQVKIPETDITAYTSIFASTTDTAKSLKSFSANAKKSSPRENVAHYLISKRQLPTTFKVPKLKTAQANPYLDVWTWSCQETGFVGPLGIPAYAQPEAVQHSHPMLPVLFHHFGCVCPSFEALSVVSQLVTSQSADGVVDMASGNGYWTYMLRRLGVQTTAIDNGESNWKTMWIEDTIKANGVEWMRNAGGAKGKILLMVYMVTKGSFTQQVIRAYQGNTIVVVGTQNANRFTGFKDVTVEEYFERDMKLWSLVVRIPLPSFAGKDEALYVYQKP